MRAGSTIIKLLIFSFIVGFILITLDISPENLLASIVDTVKDIFEWLIQNAGDAMAYVITGAAVVVPIWLVFAILKYLRRGGPAKD